MESRIRKYTNRNGNLGSKHPSFVTRISPLVLALLAMLPSCCYAQVVSLDSVLQLIGQNHPMLKEYDNRARAYDAYADGATSWMAPMIGAGTFMKPYPNQEVLHENEKGAWMFSLEQDIPNPAKLKANRNYLASKSAVEQQSRSAAFNTLRAGAKRLYYDWLVLEEKLIVLEDNARVMDLTIRLARIRYPYNQGSLGNIYKAEGRLSEINNMLLMTRAEIEEKSQMLKSLMNIPASDSIMVDTTTTVAFQASRIYYDTAALVDRRSDVKRIEETINMMALNQQVQRAAAKPDFRIRFDHMQPIGDMPRQFSAMAMVSIPIAPWSSKMYRSEVKGMQYDIEAMKREREAILIEARGKLAGMASRIGSMEQQLKNYREKILPALKKNYQTLMLAYEENREQLPIVIDGWEAMNMAEIEYLDKVREYYGMIVAYEQEAEQE